MGPVSPLFCRSVEGPLWAVPLYAGVFFLASGGSRTTRDERGEMERSAANAWDGKGTKKGEG